MVGTQELSQTAEPDRPHRLRVPSLEGETTFFVVALFLGLHTAISVAPDDKVLVPYVLSFVAALGILSINIRAIGRGVIDWFVLLACFMAALALVASVRDGDYVIHLRASAQFVYSVVIGYAAFLGLSVLRRQDVERTFFWMAVFLIVGAALEIYGPIRPFSDWFRSVFNAWYGLYDSDARDIVDYGGYRPKFFANEPSVLGLTIGFAFCFWLSAKKSFAASEAMLAALLIGVAFLLVRSPNVLLGPLAFGFIFLVSGRNRRRVRGLLGKAAIAGALGSVALAPAFFLFLTLTLPNIPSYLASLSFFERIELPFLVASDALRSFPLFGVGLGNNDQMNQLALKTFQSMNMIASLSTKEMADPGRSAGNVFWQYWIVFGFAGGLIFTFVFSDLLRVLRVRHSSFVVLGIAAATFWQGFGGVSAPLAFFAVFAVAAMCKLRDESHAASGNTPMGAG
jgi:hypothetical protein